MRYLGLFLGLVVAGLILTCAVRHSNDCAEWFAGKQAQEDTQFQTAVDMLRDMPTAAGKK
jgi:hypothetical protein